MTPRPWAALVGFIAIAGLVVGCSSQEATQTESTDRQAGAFYEDIRVCLTSATDEPKVSYRWGADVQDHGFRDIEGQSFSIFPTSTPQCGYMDAALGIPKLPVTISIDGINQGYWFRSTSQCFNYILPGETVSHCLPTNQAQSIPIGETNKIQVTVTASDTKESSGRWNGYTFNVRIDGTGT